MNDIKRESTEMINPIVIAVPFFFLGMGIEYWVANRKALHVYRWNDTFANLFLGTGQVLIAVLIKAPLLLLYEQVYQCSFTPWEMSPYHWVIGFLLIFLIFSYALYKDIWREVK